MGESSFTLAMASWPLTASPTPRRFRRLPPAADAAPDNRMIIGEQDCDFFLRLIIGVFNVDR